MNNFDNSISMESIFREESPIAKEIRVLEEKVQKGTEILDNLKVAGNVRDQSSEFLDVFYNEKKNQKYKGSMIKKFERKTDLEILTELYGILAYNVEKLENKKEELNDFVKGI